MGKLKNMPGHGGNGTYDLWNSIVAHVLCQLSYAVRLVRVCDISELSLAPFDISYFSYFIKINRHCNRRLNCVVFLNIKLHDVYNKN